MTLNVAYCFYVLVSKNINMPVFLTTAAESLCDITIGMPVGVVRLCLFDISVKQIKQYMLPGLYFLSHLNV